MRIRKIHTVVAVSVALVLVARTIESRRRTEAWAPSEPAPTPPEPIVAVEEVASIDEVAVVAPPEEPLEEPAVVISPGRRALAKPLALLAAAIVLAGALAGTLLVVTAGATPPHP